MNITFDNNRVKFIYLHGRKWIESSMYPYFTLLGQALGSVYLGFEAIRQLNPGQFVATLEIFNIYLNLLLFVDIFIETTGYTFTLPVFKYLGQCKTGCYVHYPIITREMLKRVSNRETIYNNRSMIARSPFLTTAKLLYYQAFAWVRIF